MGAVDLAFGIALIAALLVMFWMVYRYNTAAEAAEEVQAALAKRAINEKRYPWAALVAEREERLKAYLETLYKMHRLDPERARAVAGGTWELVVSDRQAVARRTSLDTGGRPAGRGGTMETITKPVRSARHEAREKLNAALGALAGRKGLTAAQQDEALAKATDLANEAAKVLSGARAVTAKRLTEKATSYSGGTAVKEGTPKLSDLRHEARDLIQSVEDWDDDEDLTAALALLAGKPGLDGETIIENLRKARQLVKSARSEYEDGDEEYDVLGDAADVLKKARKAAQERYS